MSTNVLQAPFELFHKDYVYENKFETSSPPSSPCSLYAVDSSPPSSPANHMLDLEESDEEMHFDIASGVSVGDGSPGASPASVRRANGKGKGRQDAKLDASPAHPYAASTRAVKRPPSYSKDATRQKVKRQRNDSDPQRDVFEIAERASLYERDGYLANVIPSTIVTSDLEGEPGHQEVGGGVARSSHDPEHTLWEETLAQAVDGVECKIDLSGQRLTYIPPKIADLSKLVVIRNDTSSVRELAPRRTCSKSTNSIVFGAGKLGQREDEIHLFLAKNNIAMLPNELFNLDALVVLSLRMSLILEALLHIDVAVHIAHSLGGNCLTEIPPLICQLRNLRELNVANNKLRYLPSEIMALKLSSLAVDPNPFEENPYAKSEPSKDRWFGPIERKHSVVPLTELSLRVLLAPSLDQYGLHDSTLPVSGARRQETVLEHHYDLPLRSDYLISPALRETLSSCVPGSIASLQSTSAAPYSSPEARRPSSRAVPRACVSVCPSQRHLDINESSHRRPVFVTHAEECLSWEKHVAGQRVGGEAGIPVRWRGCSGGCLDQLEKTSADDSTYPDAGGEDDWTTGMEVDVRESDGGRVTGLRSEAISFPSSKPLSKRDFKTFDSTDIDLDV